MSYGADAPSVLKAMLSEGFGRRVALRIAVGSTALAGTLSSIQILLGGPETTPPARRVDALTVWVLAGTVAVGLLSALLVWLAARRTQRDQLSRDLLERLQTQGQEELTAAIAELKHEVRL